MGKGVYQIDNFNLTRDELLCLSIQSLLAGSLEGQSLQSTEWQRRGLYKKRGFTTKDTLNAYIGFMRQALYAFLHCS